MPNIRVHITDEEDLFDHFVADRNMLNDGFISFMKKQYDANRDGEPPVIHFISDVPLDKHRISAALARFIAAELAQNKLQRRRNRWMELYLFLLGVICIAAGILLQRAGTIYLQILSLTAGFAIKEAATIFFMKNPQNTFERARILYISRAKLVFES